MNSQGDKPEEARQRSRQAAEGGVTVSRERLEDARMKELVTLMQAIDPYDFEEFVAELWRRKGWNAEVSSGGSDRGVDVVASKEYPYRQKALIQVKRYSDDNKVGSPEIQQYASLRQQRSGVDKAIVVTSNQFTGQARELARQLNVKLVDGYRLAQMVDALDAYDLFERFLDVDVVDEEPEDETDVVESSAGGAAAGASTAADAEAPKTRDRQAGDEEVGEKADLLEAEVDVGTTWYHGVWLGLIGWLLVFYGVETYPDGVWATLFFGSWILLPVSVYVDAARVSGETDWPRYPLLYAGAAAVWFLNLPVTAYYLWRRRSVKREDTNSG